jgi:histone H1/5
MPVDKKWMNATYLAALKKGVEDGILLKSKASYKLSAEGKKTTKIAPKKKSAPKKKAASEKTAVSNISSYI